MKSKSVTLPNTISKSGAKYYKFGASFLGYAFILIYSILIVYFSNQRGNPTFLRVLYWIALSINIIQVTLISVKFVFNYYGFYSKIFDLINKILALVWIVVLLTQLIVASITFITFRFDLLFIFLFQLIAITLLLIYTNKIDYKQNKSFSKFIRNKSDISKNSIIKKREFSKALLYSLTAIFILILQIFVLILPKLPPQIDDIFSENRTLKYTYVTAEEGYYVTDVYSGLNDSVVIPLTYNNQPVLGISANAITDDGIINDLQIGEYNSEGVLESNVIFIDSNAIKLNLITSITLPDSIQEMKKDAISGRKLSSITYSSNYAFSLSSFNTPNLSVLNLMNETNPINVDYENQTDLIVNVPLSLYNTYRESFFEFRQMFKVNDEENIIIIDFETGIDYYLESQILNLNNGVARLNINDLKNKDDETSTLIYDTLIYNQDKYAREGFISNPGYVFRGWYRDQDWHSEANFDDDYIYFDTNTTIYAKWDIVKTIELDWSNYFPENGVTIINYVDSKDLAESVTLPKLLSEGGEIERLGFESLTWVHNYQEIEKTADLYNLNPENEVLKLTAVWKLKSPTISYYTSVGTNHLSGNNLSFTFDEEQLIQFVSQFEHESDEVSINFLWKRLYDNDEEEVLFDFNTNNSDTFNYYFRDHNQSGLYEFVAIAMSNTGEVASASQKYTINIAKKKLDISAYSIPTPAVYTYNGNPQKLDYTYSLPVDIGVSVLYSTDGNEYSTQGPINVKEDAYSVRYTFQKIGAESGNYEFAYAYSSISINPKPVTADWFQSDLAWSVDFKLTYDSEPHILIPSVIGLYKNDFANFELSNIPQVNAGNYVSIITGIDNPNYILDFENIVKSQAWSIIPKQIEVIWGETAKSYNGSVQNFQLYLNGLYANDIPSISVEDFSYIHSGGLVDFNNNLVALEFSAKDMGEYNISVSAFNNPNYIFNNITKTLSITPATLSANWGNLTTEYSGETKYAILEISGFKNNDELNYNINNLSELFTIITECEDYSIEPTTAPGTLIIKFGAVNADVYSISLNEVLGTNYSFSPITNSFTITPKKLSGIWQAPVLTYNGQQQYATITFNDIHPDDLENMTVADFSATYNTDTYSVLSKTATSITLGFSAKEAGNYSFSIDSFDILKFNSNYSFDPIIGKTFSIAPRLVSLSWNSTSFEYNATSHSVFAEITNIVNDDIVNLTYTGNSSTDAGDYVAQVTVDNPNYTTNTSNNHDWTITEKDIYVTVNNSNLVYDGNYQYFDLIYSGIEPSDLVTLIKTDFEYITSSNNPLNSIIYDSASTNVNGSYITRFKAINADGYEITLAPTSIILNNYNVMTTEFNLSISPLAIDYVWNYTDSYVYNQTNFSVDVSFTNLRTREDTGLIDTVTPTYSNNTKINAGTYVATLDNLSNQNYYIDTSSNKNSLTWSISPRTLDITWSGTSYVFNGVHQQKIAEATNLLGSDIITFDYEYKRVSDLVDVSSTINKGTYYAYVVGISGTNSSNYILPSGEIRTEYEITPLYLSVILSKNDFTYNGNITSGATLRLSGFPNSTEAYNFGLTDLNYSSTATLSIESTTTSYKTFNISSKNAGTYSFIINGSNNGNYVITSTSIDFTINPLPISVSWPISTYTYDGYYKNFAPTISNKVLGDVINLTYSFSGSSYLGNNISTTSMKDAGQYTLTITAIDNPNYTISGLSNLPIDGILAKTFEINKKAITLVYSNIDKVYNGSYQGVRLQVSGYIASDIDLFLTNPLIYTHSGDLTSYTSEGLNFYSVNVGTYGISVSGLNEDFDNSNYYLASSSQIDIVYQITPATIGLSWSSSILTYNGLTQQIIPSVLTSTVYYNVLSGFTDSISLNYTNNSAKDAGSYLASVTSISGEDAGNYKLPSIATKSWTINKRILTLSWSTTNTFTYDGQYHGVSLTINNFISSDIDTLTTSSFIGKSSSMTIDNLTKYITSVSLDFEQKNAGIYYYQLSSFANSNYTFESSIKTMTINKRTLTLSWSTNDTFTYDGGYHHINLIVGNLIPSDVSPLNSGWFNKTTISTMEIDTLIKNSSSVQLNFKEINAGTYYYQLLSFANSNYTFTSSLKTLTINKLTADIAWSYISPFTYDGTVRTIESLVTNIRVREDTGLSDVVTLTLTNNSYINAGTYTASIASISNTNYQLPTLKTKSWTINKAILLAEWQGNSTYEYNGINNTVTISLIGFKNSDEDTTTLSSLVYDFYNGSTTIIPVLSRTASELKLTFNIKDVGTYNFSISAINGNYQLLSGIEEVVSITQKSVVLSLSSITEFTYNGDYQGLTLTISGIADSDLSSFSGDISILGATSLEPYVEGNLLKFNIYGKDAGTYNISIKKLSSLLNYNFIDKTATFVINPKPLSFSWSTDKSFVYNGLNQGMSLSVIGIVDVDLANFSTQMTSSGGTSHTSSVAGNLLIYNVYGKDAGTYNISVGALSTLKNYTFPTQTNNFTIQKKTLTASWSTSTGSSTDTYDGLQKIVTLTINGFENSEKFTSSNFAANKSYYSYDNSISGVLKLYFSATTAGNYDYLVSEFNNANYNFVSTDFSYLINKANLTVSYSGSSISTYNGSIINRTITISGFTSNDITALSTTNLNYLKSDNVLISFTKSGTSLIITYGAENVGIYNFVMDTISNSNYNNVNISDTLEITKKTITLALGSTEVGSVSELIFNFSGLVGTDQIDSNDFVVTYYDDELLTNIVDPTSSGTYYFTVEINLSNYDLDPTYLNTFNIV